MFVLSTVTHILSLHPKYFGPNDVDAIMHELNDKLANKVIRGVGLVIGVFEILSVKGGVVPIGRGMSEMEVVANLIVFQPFVGEVISASLSSCHPKKGICLSLGFFDDIIVSPEHLRKPFDFNQKDKVWVWQYIDAEQPDQKFDFVYEAEQPIRFRVLSVKYGRSSETHSDGAPDHDNPPMTVYGTVDQDGLGMTSWWSE